MYSDSMYYINNKQYVETKLTITSVGTRERKKFKNYFTKDNTWKLIVIVCTK